MTAHQIDDLVERDAEVDADGGGGVEDGSHGRLVLLHEVGVQPLLVGNLVWQWVRRRLDWKFIQDTPLQKCSCVTFIKEGLDSSAHQILCVVPSYLCL